MSADVKRLYGDDYIKKRSGIFEFILAAGQDLKLLEVRVFDEATKQSVYAKQTRAAEGEERIQLPALRDWARREQEQDL